MDAVVLTEVVGIGGDGAEGFCGGAEEDAVDHTAEETVEKSVHPVTVLYVPGVYAAGAMIL